MYLKFLVCQPGTCCIILRPLLQSPTLRVSYMFLLSHYISDLILQCNRISQLECCKGANGAYATSGSTLCGSFWGGSTANSGTCDNIITQVKKIFLISWIRFFFFLLISTSVFFLLIPWGDRFFYITDWKKFCNQNINDPTCSCLNSPMWRNPPTGFQANPVCFDQNCTTNAKVIVWNKSK